MLVLTDIVCTFPSVLIPSDSRGAPVEVCLISQLGHGAGDELFSSAMQRQSGHAHFVDELDEPSARLGAMNLDAGDPSSLYSFGVGPKGHPFHRHAGQRVFTAVSGSGGVQLRFSTAPAPMIAQDPHAFIRALRFVDVPPDCLFTVRFGGGTWHQFVPKNSSHPALFALSCHTNELSGALSEMARARVLANGATIPSLTELLPENVSVLLHLLDVDLRRVPTTALSLDGPAGGLQNRFCAWYRGRLGRWRGRASRRRSTAGYLSSNLGWRDVATLRRAPDNSLLSTQYAGEFDEEDMFTLTLDARDAARRTASEWMERFLDGFVGNRPLGVTRLMALRNWVLKPFGLRTSPLGCPASSLLGSSTRRFGRFPILDSSIDREDQHAQVLLGADDKHLAFRSCAGVRINASGAVTFSLGTRVKCNNVFGRIYMAVIGRVHRTYIGPTMLNFAVDWATR